MKIAALTWDSNNVGDDVQTVAVEQHLPHVDFYVRRDDLKNYDGERCLLVMNGWFAPSESSWPPSDKIVPIFFGFHAERRSQATLNKHVDYLKRHEPIGCRDSATVDLMKSIGVEAYLSLCSTLTFPTQRDRDGRDLFLVDADAGSLAGAFRKRLGLKTRIVSHSFMNVDTPLRMQYARELIASYGRTAGLVVTSRIHCAMPCVAMGIPVAFVGKRTPRIEIVEEIGLRIREAGGLSWHLGLGRVDEWPTPIAIDPVRERLTADLRRRIDAVLSA